MGRKKKRSAPNARDRIFCYYCDRTFQNEQELLSHQREKHLRCPTCNKRMLSVPSLMIHSQQMHNHELNAVPNAISGRDGPDLDVLGMENIPSDYYARLEGRSKKEATATSAATTTPASAAPGMGVGVSLGMMGTTGMPQQRIPIVHPSLHMPLQAPPLAHLPQYPQQQIMPMQPAMAYNHMQQWPGAPLPPFHPPGAYPVPPVPHRLHSSTPHHAPPPYSYHSSPLGYRSAPQSYRGAPAATVPVTTVPTATAPGAPIGRPWVAPHDTLSTSVPAKQEGIVQPVSAPASQSAIRHPNSTSAISVTAPPTLSPKASVPSGPIWTSTPASSDTLNVAPLNNNSNSGTKPAPLTSDVKLVFESIDTSPEELRAQLPRYSVKTVTT